MIKFSFFRTIIGRIRYKIAMYRFIFFDTPSITDIGIGTGKERMRNMELMLDRSMKRMPKREDYY